MKMNRKYTVAKTYGKALYSEALQLNSVSEIYQEMLQLREVYRQVPDLGDILTDDRLSVYEKVNIVKDLENSFSDAVAKFIHTVDDYGRMDEMPQIIDEFEHLYYEQFGIIVVDVTTAVALNMDQITQLKLPPNPSKIPEGRSTGYVKSFGNECWELDAMEPDLINTLIKKSIRRYRDGKKYNSIIRREHNEKEKK